MSNQTKLKVLISDSFDPWFNLATEDWIFRDMDPSFKILFLWRNDQTVVIGRFQNPWSECNTAKMEKDNINLARRQSGGGAVFQDLGNTNFTFMSAKDNFNKNQNNNIIIRSLKSFGIEATPSGRNDINVSTVDGEKKISGSAFKETKDRSFHHGTLLINTDLAKLSNYLNPHPKKLESKGIQSVRARVVNLKELTTSITHENLTQKIIEEFFIEYNSSCEIEYLKSSDLLKIEKLNEYYERLKDWNWRFGEAPQFSHTMSEYFNWGLVEVHLNVTKAQIDQIKIFSDSLHPELIELLMASLDKVSYNRTAVKIALDNLKLELPMYADYLEEFSSWLQTEIN
jgi:lipoate-protein ligase A